MQTVACKNDKSAKLHSLIMFLVPYCTPRQCSPLRRKFMECSIINPGLSRQKSPNFSAFHWSPHGSLFFIGQHFVNMRVVHLPKRAKTSLITESDRSGTNHRIKPGGAGRAKLQYLVFNTFLACLSVSLRNILMILCRIIQQVNMECHMQERQLCFSSFSIISPDPYVSLISGMYFINRLK